MSVKSMQRLYKGDFHNYVWYSLHANGWRYVLIDKDMDEPEEDTYQITILGEYETIITAHISSDISGFKHQGCLGVNWLEGEYEYQGKPMGFSDIEDMLYALEKAEDNLLTLEIPFDDDYEFHGRNKANKKRRNDAVRRKMDISAQENAIREKLLKERNRQ